MSVKKILALLLAAMMVFGMTSAMADVTTTETTANGQPIRTNTDKPMVFPLTKTLYFFNEQGASVYEPNITYTFTITPADVTNSSGDAATVTDVNNNTAAVKPGDMRAFGEANATTAHIVKLAFDKDHAIQAVTSDGIGVTKAKEVTFNGEALVSTEGVITPGIYRYVITETTDVTKASVGIVAGADYDDTLILDIYVTNDGTVTGAVIHDPGDTGDDDDSEDGDVDTSTEKTTGFGGGTTPTETETDDPDNNDDDGQKTGTTSVSSTFDAAENDTYTTYNFAVTKVTSGDMADPSHNFPFTIDVTNSVNGAAYSVFSDVAETTSFTYAATNKVTSAGTDQQTALLKNADFIYFKGVPTIEGNASTVLSVKVTEENDTEDTYKVNAKQDSNYIKINDESTAATTRIDVAKDETAETETLSVKNGNANLFTIDNELKNVSPTGVVLRFAPYFAMFAAGCALFLILATKRSKKEEE